MKVLWVSFIFFTILNAGNMNYQQEQGYTEINPIYSEHPSKQRVYITKALGIAGVYGLTKIFPKYDKPILIGANTVAIGAIVYDTQVVGIEMKVSF
jgi:hypothetical protein